MKLISVKIKREGWGSSRVLTISSESIDVQKETATLYKLGNTGLMFKCRRQIPKSEMGGIMYDNYDKRNYYECNNINLIIIDSCEDIDVESKIQECKVKICEFAKIELDNRMNSLLQLQKDLKKISEK